MKVALTVPVLPSVTVTLLILIDGGSSGDQSPSLSSTETAFEPRSAAATSGRPSPLKSPTVTAKGHEPAAWSIGEENVPSPKPRSTLTVPPT